MAVTIHTTVGSSIANSYISLQEAQDIIDGLIEDDDVTAWASATTDQKNRALFTSTQRIDRERFLGARVNDTQALQWPRTGVRKPILISILMLLVFLFAYQQIITLIQKSQIR